MHRVPELDGLRGLAAALVVAHHLWPKPLFFGWAAVDLFFVLSGFLITGIILKHGQKPGFLLVFYMRRNLRIWPIYYFAIILALVCTHPEAWAPLYYLTYTQNIPSYWGGCMPVWHEMVHTWTLAIEEQFYLIWPVALFFASRPSRVAMIALGVAALSMFARSAGFPPNLLIARCDGFALGGLLAALQAAGFVRTTRLAACAATLCGFVVMGWSIAASGTVMENYRPANVTISTFLSFGLVAAVVLGAGNWKTAVLRSRPLVYLGTISYGLYLYHYLILLRSYSLTIRLGIQGTGAEPSFLAALSLTVAVLSWHLIERPILRLKDRIPYRASSSNDAAPSSRAAGLIKP